MWLQAAVSLLLFWLVLRAVFHLPGGREGPATTVVRRVVQWCVRRLPGGRRSRRGPTSLPEPVRRPLGDIADEARRLAVITRQPPRGTSYAKHMAACGRYDRVLGEACAALGVEHLLKVLPPGKDLDAERTRVETALWIAGLRLEDAL